MKINVIRCPEDGTHNSSIVRYASTFKKSRTFDMTSGEPAGILELNK